MLDAQTCFLGENVMEKSEKKQQNTQVFPVPEHILKSTRCDRAKYDEMYRRSVEDPDGFWAEEGKRLDWIKPYSIVKNTSFEGDVSIKWFEDGTLNASVNCIDRHLPHKANDVALIWEGDNPAYHFSITYQQLYNHVCRFANVLKRMGVKRGDRVTLYLPMIPETAYAMLACARIGAVHSVVFGGFSADALAGRINDCDSHWAVTADEGVRAGRSVPLKANLNKAAEKCPHLKGVMVVRHTGGAVDWVEGRDHWYHEEALNVDAHCEPEEMSAEDPLFILYTSGSTGKPKGVVHTTGGYLAYASMTHEYVFDYQPGQVYWCAADVGWVTGHSYIIYGPLANGATTLMFEGVPTWPGADRFWRIVAKHKVNILYTAPTALRALMREGDEPVERHDLSSLRILGSVGEPINPEAWLWYHRVVGKGRCPIVDTWWQTETGGMMINPLPGAMDLKPGSATRPFFGVKPALVAEAGDLVEGEGEGNLVMTDSWPGQARTLYGDHERFIETYFSTYKGMYFSGDGARRDADGDYWVTGRVDDVINVSGHRMGTAEVESALVAHRLVAEAAVVGYPHDIKGQGIYCYVTLNAGLVPSEDLADELRKWVRKDIGPIATPDAIQFSPSLPKTRSGKIMRRILRKIAENDTSNLGDTSTLADPSVVQSLIDGRLSV